MSSTGKVKIIGDYIFKDKIGKGSFADVYNCEHKTSGKRYALKIVNREHLLSMGEPRLITGLESEIKLMKEIDHENIVRLHDFFSTEKNFYLVLELCNGGDLNKYIKKRKILSEKVSIGFLLQLANGLAFLQEKNLIHRDLKPANVLLSEFSDTAVLKLADFGFARHLGAAVLAQTRCGTPLYMAPEILEAREYDAKADVWSLGCIFYEMLVGTCPFKGSNEADLLHNIKTKDLSIPKEVEISKLSVDLLAKLLERNPNKRASADQLMAIKGQLPRFTASSGQSSTSRATSSSEKSNFEEPSGRQRSSSRITEDQISQPSVPHQSNLTLNTTMSSSGHAIPQQSRSPPVFGNLNPSSATAATTLSMTPPAPPPQYRGQTSSNSNAQPSPLNSNSNNGGYYDSYYAQAAGGIQVQRQNSSSGKGGQFSEQSLSARRYSTDSMPSVVPAVLSSPSGGHISSNSNSNASPAAAIIGNFSFAKAVNMLFSPSHSGPVATASSSNNYTARNHAPNYSPAHNTRGSSHDRRSISLDRAAPPSFSAGPGPSQRSDPQLSQQNQHSGRLKTNTVPIPNQSSANSFFPDDDATSIRAYNSNRYEGLGPQLSSSGSQAKALSSARKEPLPSSADSTLEEDFVIIQNTSNSSSNRSSGSGASASGSRSHSEGRASESQDPAQSSGDGQYSYRPSQSVQFQQGDDLRMEASTSSHYLTNVMKRCQIFCRIVHEITSLGDQYIHKIFASENWDANTVVKQQPQQGTRVRSGSVQKRAGTTGAQSPAAIVETYVIACSLYFHALKVLKNLMGSLLEEVPQSTSTKQRATTGEVILKLRDELNNLYKQLIRRTEQCHSNISMLFSLDRGSANPLEQRLFQLPVAEVVMLDAAIKKEQDAAFEELVGNLPLACKMYISAQELVDAVLVTVSEADEQRRLQAHADQIRHKMTVCLERAEHLGFT